MKIAVFGGGCFWCTEAVFKMLKGIKKAVPGYSGGSKEDATYEKVSTGTTGHAEVAYIEYDPDEISYRDLLTVFFASHDPTTPNRQGNDIGPQYRSVIFYTDEGQKKEAEKYIGEIEGAVTELEPLVNPPAGGFFPAEDYHKNYFENHREQLYCELVINPKLEKVQKEFARLLENEKQRSK